MSNESQDLILWLPVPDTGSPRHNRSAFLSRNLTRDLTTRYEVEDDQVWPVRPFPVFLHQATEEWRGENPNCQKEYVLLGLRAGTFDYSDLSSIRGRIFEANGWGGVGDNLDPRAFFTSEWIAAIVDYVESTKGYTPQAVVPQEATA